MDFKLDAARMKGEAYLHSDRYHRGFFGRPLMQCSAEVAKTVLTKVYIMCRSSKIPGVRAHKGKVAHSLRLAKKAVAKLKEIDELMRGVVLITEENEIELDPSIESGGDFAEVMEKLERLGDLCCEQSSNMKKQRGIAFYKLAVSVARRHAVDHELAPLYNSVALTFVELSQFDDAIEYYQRQLECIGVEDHLAQALVHAEVAHLMLQSADGATSDGPSEKDVLRRFQQALDIFNCAYAEESASDGDLPEHSRTHIATRIHVGLFDSFFLCLILRTGGIGVCLSTERRDRHCNRARAAAIQPENRDFE